MAEEVKAKPKDYVPLAIKIARANREIGTIAKDGNNRYQHYSFQSEAAIKAAVQKVLSENGFAIIPTFEIVNREQQATKRDGINNFVYVQGTFTITDGVETIVGSMPGAGSDTGEKAVQKACTSAQKYFYKQLFNITDKDEDPDTQDSNPDGGYVKSKKQNRSSKQDLRNYTVKYNGQQVPMYLVVKHASEGNKQAKNFANSLKGKDMEVFQQLAKQGIIS